MLVVVDVLPRTQTEGNVQAAVCTTACIEIQFITPARPCSVLSIEKRAYADKNSMLKMKSPVFQLFMWQFTAPQLLVTSRNRISKTRQKSVYCRNWSVFLTLTSDCFPTQWNRPLWIPWLAIPTLRLRALERAAWAVTQHRPTNFRQIH